MQGTKRSAAHVTDVAIIQRAHMQNLIIRLFVNAAALWVAARVVPGIGLSGELSPVLIVAAVFGLVNAMVKPIVMFLSIPFVILTLGLFILVINAGMLMLTAALLDSLSVAGFEAALLGSLMVSLVSLLFSLVLPER
jgi:putative membrane protein